MDIDKTTLNDLSLFHHEEEFSVFNKLNHTLTSGGREWLIRFLSEPFSDVKRIVETQQILQTIAAKQDRWPVAISNGTIMVIEKFYEYAIDSIPDSANLLNAISYRVLHAPDYSLVRYSVGHFADFVSGFRQLIALFDVIHTPGHLKTYLQRAQSLISHPVLQKLSEKKNSDRFSAMQTVYFGHYLRYKFKQDARELIDIYGRLDAWLSMAVSVQKFDLSFPEFISQEHSYVEVESLYHLLLPKPVSYDIHLHPDNNFIFLTGANMAGKSTFIRAVGVAVYLAHVGMGVPARSMKLTLFDGIVSNINVMDNIVKGESYFFNEVQRIKNTILKINNQKKWLVLIDELFKGTNVQDAMKCSSAVIRGLLKIENSLFILSTHLYEIGEELKSFPNISFRFFETRVKEDELEFSYQLKEGISNDRLGYLILKREHVVDLLESL